MQSVLGGQSWDDWTKVQEGEGFGLVGGTEEQMAFSWNSICKTCAFNIAIFGFQSEGKKTFFSQQPCLAAPQPSLYCPPTVPWDQGSGPMSILPHLLSVLPEYNQASPSCWSSHRAGKMWK